MVCEQRWQMRCLSVPCSGMQRGAPPAPLPPTGPVAEPVPILVGTFEVDAEEVLASKGFVPSSNVAEEELAELEEEEAAAFDDDEGHVGTPEERPAFSSRLSMF